MVGNVMLECLLNTFEHYLSMVLPEFGMILDKCTTHQHDQRIQDMALFLEMQNFMTIKTLSVYQTKQSANKFHHLCYIYGLSFWHSILFPSIMIIVTNAESIFIDNLKIAAN